MSFPRYPKYKNSGVEWLGEVPAHWHCVPMKYLVRLQSGGTPSKERLDYWEGEIPWASAKDMKVDRLFDTEDHITAIAIDEGVANLVPSHAVIVVVRGMILARAFPVTLVMREMAINQDLKAVMCGDRLRTEFLAWYLRGTTDESLRRLDEAGHGTKALRMEAWTSLEFSLPSLDEQKVIAAFLDRETAKIDALVAEQEKLIALLKEKRQAVISHAITKGLNPDVPMKDSGIEWLGEVPAHWTVKRLKTISPFITVGVVVNPSDYVADEGLPFIYGGDISEGRINLADCRRISVADSQKNSKTILSAGDLLTVRVGAPGITAVVSADAEGGNCASVMLVRKGGFNSDWLCYAMNSRMVRFQVEIVQYGAAQEQFNIGHAINFWIATPPANEQAMVATYLVEAAGRFDSLASQAETGIALLKERRSALISAAVTGKIDVRGFGAQKEAA